MKRWFSRVMVAAAVALSGMSGQAASAETGPGPADVAAVDDGEIAVFLCTPSARGCHKRPVTAKQRRDVEAFLTSTPGVTEVRFVSRAASYAEFRREFDGETKMLAEVRAKDLPESFWIRVSQTADRARIASAAGLRPGVARVVDQLEVRRATRSRWEAELSVFLCTSGTVMPGCRHGRGPANRKAATAKEKKAIVAVIERIPGLESYEYEDQRTAYRNFAEAYADRESLIAATRVSDMPESYRLSIRSDVNRGPWRRRLARMPGVTEVFDYECFVQEVRLRSEYGLKKVGARTRACE
ncbi:permease-like cell division protein FtsX [Nonomuraea sp. NPDC001831]|uniref:permease-like cell division protein FtsX n=1 Tax=Nonomuraea sp. NPDC001831 TaxID=3364340 RepID=UPI0036ACEC7D